MKNFLLFVMIQMPLISMAQDIPKQLEPWKEWALKDRAVQRFCPTLDETTICVWPTSLDLDVTDQGGRFRFTVRSFVALDVQLPGSQVHWPEQVKANGRSVPVLKRGDRAVVFLEAGTWLLEGQFFWDRLPERLLVPSQVGALSFKRFGKVSPNPFRQGNELLMRGDATEEKQEKADSDGLSMHVWRHLRDGQPMQLVTALQLKISGKRRELDLGDVVPEGFVIYEVNSDLNWRFVEDRLQVQAVAGEETIEIQAWARDNAVLAPVHPIQEWPNQERWFFQTQPELRSVVVRGGSALDPGRFEVPGGMPEDGQLYGLGPNDTLVIDERMRGMAQVPPNDLRLQRTMWLDFDGKGYSYRDFLKGTLEDAWRLEMTGPYQLGAISLNSRPQLITVLDDRSKPGVNLSDRNLELVAEGRVPVQASLPVVGWDTNMSQALIDIRIPAGWRPIIALGADRSHGTWIDGWNVWNFFWVLLMAMITAKLFSKRVGLLALVTMTLLNGEAGAPMVLWFPLLAMIALGRVVKESNQEVVRKGFYIFLVLLLIPTVPFIRNQAMWALYPESSADRISPIAGHAERKMQEESQKSFAIAPTVYKQAPSSNLHNLEDALVVSSYAQDRAQIQTGPGMPTWRGREVTVEWSGPISNQQDFRLILLPPWAMRLVTLLRIGSVVMLLACLCGLRLSGRRSGPGKLGAALMLGLCCLGQAQAQEIPSKETLNDLADYLTRRPDCYPECATLSKVHLQRKARFWQAQMTVHVAAATIIPLPKEALRASLGGKPTLMARYEDELLVYLEAGIHEVTVDFIEKRTLNLDFPLKPISITWEEESDWQLEGVSDQGRIAGQVYLEFNPEQGDTSVLDTWEGIELATYVKVERVLSVGQEWRIYTNIEVLSDAGFQGRIPIFEGERFLEEDIQIESGYLVVNIKGGQDVMLESRLTPTANLKWSQPEDAFYETRWILEIQPIWHASWEGIPTIRYFTDGGSFSPSWAPRRGESLELQFQRPQAGDGMAFTYESVVLEVKPGARMTEYELVLRSVSAIGGERTIQLPDGAEVRETSLGNKIQPIRFEGDGLVLRHEAGDNEQRILFGLNQGISTVFSPADLDLGQAAVNIDTEITVPAGRWVLMAFGPGQGPVIMFWSILFVVCLGAMVLRRFDFKIIGVGGWILLGLGLSQLHIYSSIVAISWFALISKAAEREQRGLPYNFSQVLTVVMTLVFGMVLLAVIYNGLLANPNMYIYQWKYDKALSWYLDRFNGNVSGYTVFSLPMWAYRLAMFGWAFWLASALPKWIRFAWDGFSSNGIWHQSITPKRPSTGTPEPVTEPKIEPSESE